MVFSEKSTLELIAAVSNLVISFIILIGLSTQPSGAGCNAQSHGPELKWLWIVVALADADATAAAVVIAVVAIGTIRITIIAVSIHV